MSESKVKADMQENSP